MTETHNFRIGDKVRVHEAGASFDKALGLIRADMDNGLLVQLENNTSVIIDRDSLEYIGRD